MKCRAEEFWNLSFAFLSRIGKFFQSPATWLLIAQLAMVAICGMVAFSPLYSRDFERQMQLEQLLYAKENDSAKRKQLTAYHRKTRSSLDIEQAEIIARSNLGKNELATNSRALINVCRNLRSNLDEIGSREHCRELKQIMLRKLIRTQLRAAEICLSAGEYNAVDLLARKSMEDLRELDGENGLSPAILYLRRILALQLACRKKQLDGSGAQIIASILSRLRKPEYARSWFVANGIKDFESSYPPEYLIRYKTSTFGSGILNQSALEECLSIVSREDVSQTTRLAVLLYCAREARTRANSKLARLSYEIWSRSFPHLVVDNRQEAYLAGEFLELALTDGLLPFRGAYLSGSSGLKSPDFALDRKIENGIEKGYYSSDFAQQYLDFFMTRMHGYRAWPPSSVKARKLMLERIDELLALAGRQKLDPTMLKLARVEVLISSDNPRKAREELISLVESSAEKTWLDIARQNTLAAASVGLSNTLGKSHDHAGYQSGKEVLEKVLDKVDWQTAPKLDLLCALHRREGDPIRRSAYFAELDKLYRSPELPAGKRLEVDFFMLDHLISENRLDEAARITSRVESSLGSDSTAFARFASQVLAYRRAYPGYSETTRKMSLESKFPDSLFQRVPELTRKKFGAVSETHWLCVLWLAQYELCRGKQAIALKLCKFIIDNPKGRSSKAFPCAQVMAGFLSGDSLEEIFSRERAKKLRVQGAKEEMVCLSTIFKHIGKFDIGERTLEFAQQLDN